MECKSLQSEKNVAEKTTNLFFTVLLLFFCPSSPLLYWCAYWSTFKSFMDGTCHIHPLFEGLYPRNWFGVNICKNAKWRMLKQKLPQPISFAFSNSIIHCCFRLPTLIVRHTQLIHRETSTHSAMTYSAWIMPFFLSLAKHSLRTIHSCGGTIDSTVSCFSFIFCSVLNVDIDAIYLLFLVLVRTLLVFFYFRWLRLILIKKHLANKSIALEIVCSSNWNWFITWLCWKWKSHIDKRPSCFVAILREC